MALAGALLGTSGPAAALTLTQSQNISITGGAGFTTQTLTWNQFNTLGGTRTLTGISFRANGTFGSSFSVTNNDSANATVDTSSAKLNINFSGSGPKSTNGLTGTVSPLATSPLSDGSGPSIAPGNTQVFTISGNQSVDTGTVNLFTSFASYFTGSGTVTSTVSRLIDITTTGGEYAVSTTAVSFTGSTASSQGATLIYEYTEIAPAVPGPLAMAGAAAAFGWSRRLRRRVAATATATATARR